MSLPEIKWTQEELEKIVQNWMNHVEKEEEREKKYNEWDPAQHVGENPPGLGYPLEELGIMSCNEAGYGWGLPGISYCTEINGTHWVFITIRNSDDLWKEGAAAIAKKLFEKSKDFPGWRTMYAEISQWSFILQLYGGIRR